MDIIIKVNEESCIEIPLDKDDNSIESIMKEKYNMKKSILLSGHNAIIGQCIMVGRNDKYREHSITFLTQFYDESKIDKYIKIRPDDSDEIIDFSKFLYLLKITNTPEDTVDNATEKSRSYFLTNKNNTGRMTIQYTFYRNQPYRPGEYFISNIEINTAK